METIKHVFEIGGSSVLLVFEPVLKADDKTYLVHGFGTLQGMGQNELGGWEFIDGVPEELAMLEDDTSLFIEAHELKSA
jgi:hypothetical protein